MLPLVGFYTLYDFKLYMVLSYLLNKKAK